MRIRSTKTPSILVLLIMLATQSAFAEWFDDFDAYAVGVPLNAGNSDWDVFINQPGAGIQPIDYLALSSPKVIQGLGVPRAAMFRATHAGDNALYFNVRFGHPTNPAGSTLDIAMVQNAAVSAPYNTLPGATPFVGLTIDSRIGDVLINTLQFNAVAASGAVISSWDLNLETPKLQVDAWYDGRIVLKGNNTADFAYKLDSSTTWIEHSGLPVPPGFTFNYVAIVTSQQPSAPIWVDNVGTNPGELQLQVVSLLSNQGSSIEATKTVLLHQDLSQSIAIDAYTIGSASGSLSPAGFNGFAGHGVAGWELVAPSANALSELNLTGSTTLAAGAGQVLGSAFTTGAAKDLTLQYHVVGASTQPRTGIVLYKDQLYGDANGDGVVNIFDINLVSSRWAGVGPAGDVNLDGVVNIFDVNTISSHWLNTLAGGTAAVPEPSTLALAAVALAMSVFRLRRKGWCMKVIDWTRAHNVTHEASYRATEMKTVGMPKVLSIVIVMLTVLVAPVVPAQALDRGHRILVDRGLQIQAGYEEITTGNLAAHEAVFAQSNFTGRFLLSGNFIPVDDPAWGGQWGGVYPNFVFGTDYAESNLIALQAGDEQSLADPTELFYAKNFLRYWRERFPDTLGFTNQAPTGNSVPVLRNYMTVAQPDILMIDYYGFGSGGGSPTATYQFMQTYRQLAMGGNDGTGVTPIPYGRYLQLDHSFTGHVISDSEARLDQFANWAFGYTFSIGYTYSPGTPPRESVLLDQGWNPTPLFYQVAETNRQSLNLGPTLVRLLSTDIRFIPGQHKSFISNVFNTVPQGIQVWNHSADPFITAITAQNLGSKNSGLKGDVLIGYFKPLQESFDGADFQNQIYFMIVNGLSDLNGTVAETRQSIHIAFNFGNTGIDSLERMGRDTGLVEVVPLVADGGGLFHLDLVLDGGTGDLFKFNTGAPFVGFGSGLEPSVPEPSTMGLSLSVIMLLAPRSSKLVLRRFWRATSARERH